MFAQTWQHQGPLYTPSASDIAYGDIIRANWLSLAFNGTATPEWLPVNAAPSGNTFVTAILSENPIAMAPDHKLNTCSALSKLGIGQPYWWVN